MAIYATAADLAPYVADNPDVPMPDDDAAERLLERAEGDVDRVCGPWPILSTGRKFDPPTLPVTSRVALSRATCAAAEYRLMVGEGELVGDAEYLPAMLTLVRPAGRISPRMVEELSGFGLIIYSGTVAPDPEVDGYPA